MNPAQVRHASLAFASLLLLTGHTVLAAMGSAFTYQGRLSDGGVFTNGTYDLQFSLYDGATTGTLIAGPLTNAVVADSNGVFTALLDFGPSAFDGSARWLEIGVREGTNDFTLLYPRQPVMPTPYAITAANLANPASVLAGTFTGSFVGDGAGLTNVAADTVTAATNSLWLATTNWVLAQGYQVTNGLTRKAISSPLFLNGTNAVVDFSREVVQVTATNHLNLVQSTNRTGAGWYAECVWYIQGGAADWTLRLNTNWVAVGTLATNRPVILASNKLTIVALSVRGGSETNVTYGISRQE